MSSLRIRVELNRGRRGIALDKLGRIAEETSKFLVMACEDAGITSSVKDWIAVNFENNSVDFDCESMVALQPEELKISRDIIRSVMSDSFDDPEVRFRIRPATRYQFARISIPIDADEIVHLGLYRNGEQKPLDWFELTKSRGRAVFDDRPETVQYFGEIQGIVHAFYKGSDHPKLVIRELISEQLVDCFFRADMYRNAVEVLLDPDSIVFVEGEVVENTSQNKIESIDVSDFRLAPEFNLNSYEALLGNVSGLTGELTTEEFIREFRDE